MTYVLENTAPEAAARMTALEQLYDPMTRRQLDAIRVAPGWACWDVGTGGGSVAWELARRASRVYATDLNTQWTRPWLHARVLVHDVVHDPPPATDLDLIHLRLVASHLPEWDEVLPRLIPALRPGGWLLVEELDPMHPYQPDPRDERDELLNRVGDAFTAVLGSRGGNPQLGRRLHLQMAAAGLVDVESDGTVLTAAGNEWPARLMQANVLQMGDQIMAHSTLTESDLGRYLEAMNDPSTTFFMPTFWAARGRRPEQAPE